MSLVARFALAGLVSVTSFLGCGEGCVERGPGPDPGANRALVVANRLPAPPAELVRRVDAAFELPAAARRVAAAAERDDRAGEPGVSVIYLGAIVETDPGEPSADANASPPPPPQPLAALVPGEPFRVRHFWKVVRPPGAGLRVFTYLRGDPESHDFTNLDDSPLRRAHPPARWQAGEILQDVQRLVLRPDWSSSSATLLVGLMRHGGHAPADRLKVRRGPAQQNAVIAVSLPVNAAVDAAKPPPAGTLVLPRATSPIVVDGRADEAAWQAAAWSADFSTARGSPEPPGRARAKLSWDDQHLYAFFSVEDPDVASPYRDRDAPLWKADCVELFLDADSNFRQYIELQVNPHNAQFDSYFATTRREQQSGDETFSADMQSQVVVHGTVDQRGDVDRGWDAELAIPWEALRGGDATMAVKLPPEPGQRMRLNVVRVDQPEGKRLAVSSWNRITYADFHALERMLTVVFVAPPAPAPVVAPGEPEAPVGPPAAPAADPNSPAAPPPGTPPTAPSPGTSR